MFIFYFLLFCLKILKSTVEKIVQRTLVYSSLRLTSFDILLLFCHFFTLYICISLYIHIYIYIHNINFFQLHIEKLTFLLPATDLLNTKHEWYKNNFFFMYKHSTIIIPMKRLGFISPLMWYSHFYIR